LNVVVSLLNVVVSLLNVVVSLLNVVVSFYQQHIITMYLTIVKDCLIIR